MSDTKRKPTRPAGLGKAGQKLWREVVTVGDYELRPDEVTTLTHCCRQEDLIAAMQVELNRELAAGNFMVRGSMGQEVINPIIDKITPMRTAQAAMLARLKLPDPEAEGSGEGDQDKRATNARKAANARWGNSG